MWVTFAKHVSTMVSLWTFTQSLQAVGVNVVGQNAHYIVAGCLHTFSGAVGMKTTCSSVVMKANV